MIQAFAETIVELKREGRTTVFLCPTCCLKWRARAIGWPSSAKGVWWRSSRSRRLTTRFHAESRCASRRHRPPPPESAGTRVVSSSATEWVLEVSGPMGPLLENCEGWPWPTWTSSARRSKITCSGSPREELMREHGFALRLAMTATIERPALTRSARILRATSRSPVLGHRRTSPARRQVARAGRPVFLAAAAVLTGFQVMLVVIASTLQTGRSFALMSAMMPMGVQQAFGPSVFMLASFAGLTTFGYFHPVVVLAVTFLGVNAATEPAGEVEWGLFDLELARPVPRAMS